MGSKLYTNYIGLIKKWPVDPTRPGRDLGEALRHFVAKEFPHGPLSKVDEDKLAKSFESLNRIGNNVYFNKFPRMFPTTTCTGLSKEQLQQTTSVDYIDKINKRNSEENFWSKIIPK